MNEPTRHALASARWMSGAAAVAVLALSSTASAEYRCNKPAALAPAEKKACELARQQSPEALIRFINRTKAIYALYLYDYVTEADVERWDEARRREDAGSTAVAKAKSEQQATQKAD